MPSPSAPLPAAVAELRDPRTIRARCAALLARAEAGDSCWFTVDAAGLADAARRTAEITRARFPDLRVPPHSRFAHFDAGGVARGAQLRRRLASLDARERGRRLAEVVIVSVLVDAGAGPAWRFKDGELTLRRSEGLAVASLRWLERGALSRAGDPFAVDTQALRAVDRAQLADAFQVRDDNPLVGLEGRAALLRGLGEAVERHPQVFGATARVGGLVDALWEQADRDGRLPATGVLSAVLEGLGDIWPGRLRVAGRSLGDVWRHPAAGGQGESAGLVPFHKLSQWLTYSLLTPLEEAGLRVTDLDALTGLAEYRNGGLFVDSGALRLRDPTLAERAHPVSSELVVEWRALTVALLDRLLPDVRRALGVRAEDFPLAAMLEGGTWAAGRALAAARRHDGSPPLRIESDGTVF